MDSIASNLNIIKSNIAAACKRAGRSSSEVSIVGVTKTIEPERIRRLVELGLKDLGENRVQELCEKFPLIEDASWHLIGHLQTNKVRHVAGKVKLIHSVDSLRLIAEIDRIWKKADKTADILIEVNIAGESSKYGIEPDGLSRFLEDIAPYGNISVKGLMCVAPYVENPQENRDYFKKMRRMFVDIEGKSLNNIDIRYLSMGMTNDYEVAVEEGANIVRIGTGIFGERD